MILALSFTIFTVILLAGLVYLVERVKTKEDQMMVFVIFGINVIWAFVSTIFLWIEAFK